MKTLTLHFDNNQHIDSTLAALEKVSPVKFKHSRSQIDMRDILTKPEYIDVKAAVTLTFEDAADCDAFMRHPDTFKTYQEGQTKPVACSECKTTEFVRDSNKADYPAFECKACNAVFCCKCLDRILIQNVMFVYRCPKCQGGVNSFYVKGP